MREKIMKLARLSAMTIASTVLAMSMFSVFLTAPVQAQEDTVGINPIKDAIQLTSDDPRVIGARIVNIFLGFLGLIALVITLLGGFRWMTAQGNEDKVEEAKRILTAGVIGLVIIVSAWAIASWLLGKFAETGIVR